MSNEIVLIDKRSLLEYIALAEELTRDHDKQVQELSDIRALADIVNETWNVRLDALADLILEQPIQADRTYCNALVKAYGIMKGAI